MVETPSVKISIRNFSVSFSRAFALRNVDLEIESHRILSIIGPANSGKTTCLKAINRLLDFETGVTVRGQILLDGQDIHEEMDPSVLRRRVGMIFASAVPLPMSVFENVVYGPRRQGITDRKRLEEIAERSLQNAYLWEEVKDRLGESATKLSGGQQQRLCIARTLAVDPEVIMFDEPCSALDPISTAKVEDAMTKLKEHYTIILVTNNTKQAARVGDRTAFFLMGELIEVDETARIFTAPRDHRTDDYISGKFG